MTRKQWKAVWKEYHRLHAPILYLSEMLAIQRLVNAELRRGKKKKGAKKA